MRSIAIGLLGAGNVGTGTLRILQGNRASIERRLGASVYVKRVLVRDTSRGRDVDLDASLLTTDVHDVIADPDIRVVAELIGGIEPAKTYVLQALRAGKHVVTANKALLAAHGEEIFREAATRGLSVYFEGSVAGGVPVLRSLREGLAGDSIQTLTGIVNGTSNYILDAMTRNGETYGNALAAAQAAGFAEADPTLDVEGKDAAHKLALMVLVSFGLRVDPEEIPTEGITRISPTDIKTAGELGFVIKSLALARLDDEGLTVRVHPTLVPRGHILAGVHGSYNAVLVESSALGRSLYYGAGAGMMPTGMAVVSDIIEVCRSMMAFSDGGPPPEAFGSIEASSPRSLDHVVTENYICTHVPNVPGVLGRVASCIGEHGVSIKQMHQEAPRGHELPIDMVIITEHVEDAKMQAAIAALDTFDDILGPTDRIRILEPEPLE